MIKKLIEKIKVRIAIKSVAMLSEITPSFFYECARKAYPYMTYKNRWDVTIFHQTKHEYIVKADYGNTDYGIYITCSDFPYYSLKIELKDCNGTVLDTENYNTAVYSIHSVHFNLLKAILQYILEIKSYLIEKGIYY